MRGLRSVGMPRSKAFSCKTLSWFWACTSQLGAALISSPSCSISRGTSHRPLSTTTPTVTPSTSTIVSGRGTPRCCNQRRGISSRKAISAALMNRAGNGARRSSTWRSTNRFKPSKGRIRLRRNQRGRFITAPDSCCCPTPAGGHLWRSPSRPGLGGSDAIARAGLGH